MPIQFACPCGRQLQAQEEYAGRRTRCPVCGTELTIPAIQAAAPPRSGRPGEELGAEPDRPPRPPAQGGRWGDEDEDRPARSPQGTSGLAVAALVLGILSFVGTCLTGIPAIICGLVSLSSINKSHGRVGGRGLAIAGLVLGIVGCVIALPLLLLALLFPAVQKTREAAARVQGSNNLHQIGIAFHNYHNTFGQFPPEAVYDKDGKALYSWRVLLLPYLEEDVRYKQFHLDEPWDSAHNRTLLTPMPRVYAAPEDLSAQQAGNTYYQAFVGKGTMFDPTLDPGPRQEVHMGGGRPVFIQRRTVRLPWDVPDGTMNTIMIVEAGTAVPWSSPQDLAFDLAMPLPKLGGLRPSGYNVLLADGSVRFLSPSLSEQSLKAAISRAGGEAPPPDW